MAIFNKKKTNRLDANRSHSKSRLETAPPELSKKKISKHLVFEAILVILLGVTFFYLKNPTSFFSPKKSLIESAKKEFDPETVQSYCEVPMNERAARYPMFNLDVGPGLEVSGVDIVGDFSIIAYLAGEARQMISVRKVKNSENLATSYLYIKNFGQSEHDELIEKEIPGGVDMYKIVDIDVSDGQKEIELLSSCGATGCKHIFYTIKNHELVEIGKLDRVEKVNGDGTVTTNVFEAFFGRKDIVSYNKNKMAFDPIVLKDSYPIDIGLTIQNPSPVYSQPKDKAEVAGYLTPGKIATIISADNCEKSRSGYCLCWYRLETEGLSGWITEAQLGNYDERVFDVDWPN